MQIAEECSPTVKVLTAGGRCRAALYLKPKTTQRLRVYACIFTRLTRTFVALPSSQPLQRVGDIPDRYRWPILFRVEVNRMRRHKAYDFDNRDSAEMYGYMEARIEAMKRRTAEFEMDNARLVCELEDSRALMHVCASP